MGESHPPSSTGSPVRITLDAEGNVVQEQTHDASGRLHSQIQRTFDAYDQLATVMSAGSQMSSAFGGDGLVYRTVNGNRIVTDGEGVTLESQQVDTVTLNVGGSYDVQGRVTALTYPSGMTVFYSYDAAGNVTQVQVSQNGTLQSVASGITYNPLGNPLSLTYGSGEVRSCSYDRAVGSLDTHR